VGKKSCLKILSVTVLKERNPLKRLGEADEIAGMMAYLSSPEVGQVMAPARPLMCRSVSTPVERRVKTSTISPAVRGLSRKFFLYSIAPQDLGSNPTLAGLLRGIGGQRSQKNQGKEVEAWGNARLATVFKQ
jgi:hypothetical protein